MKILFKYATRGRPKWFRQTLDRYYDMLSGKHDCQFVVSIDRDDMSMQTPEMADYCASKPNLEVCLGDSKTKVEAINADMEGREFDILVVVSDDMGPVEHGYDDIIAQDMQRYFPDLDGALHYNDGAHAQDKLITLTIMGKHLYDAFGYIYYPEYESLWCDNEFTDLVRQWGVVTWINRVIIRHEFHKFGSDETYRKNDLSWAKDKALYHDRKAKGFPR